MTNWYKVHFRKKMIVVEGEAELARIKARKVPKVILVEPAKAYTCTECGKVSAWLPEWRWYGRWTDIEDGKPVIHLCSDLCQERFAQQKPRKRRPKPPTGLNVFLNPGEPAQHDSARWNAIHDARRSANPRLFPFPKHPREKGTVSCRWCGDEIEDRGERGHKQRTWHRDKYDDPRDCLHEWLLHTDIDAQFLHLMKRDGPGCAICGPGHGHWESAGTGFFRPSTEEGWSNIRWSVSLQVDHVIPLWKVAHLPDDERRLYFGPDNLWLLCEQHHRRKTALEAAERAEMRR